MAACQENTSAADDQPDQRFKLQFRKDYTVLMETEFTGGTTDNMIADGLNPTVDQDGVPSVVGVKTLWMM